MSAAASMAVLAICKGIAAVAFLGFWAWYLVGVVSGIATGLEAYSSNIGTNVSGQLNFDWIET